MRYSNVALIVTPGSQLLKRGEKLSPREATEHLDTQPNLDLFSQRQEAPVLFWMVGCGVIFGTYYMVVNRLGTILSIAIDS